MTMIYVLKLEPFTSFKTRGHEIVQIYSFCFGFRTVSELAQLNRVQRQRYNEILRFLLLLKCNHKNAGTIFGIPHTYEKRKSILRVHYSRKLLII